MPAIDFAGHARSMGADRRKGRRHRRSRNGAGARQGSEDSTSVIVIDTDPLPPPGRRCLVGRGRARGLAATRGERSARRLPQGTRRAGHGLNSVRATEQTQEGGQDDRQAGHQSDHLDQRRHAGARRRHAARDLPRGNAHRRLSRESSSAENFRERGGALRRHPRPSMASHSSRAGTAAKLRSARGRGEIAAMRPTSRVAARMGCKVMVFAEAARHRTATGRAGRPTGRCWPMRNGRLLPRAERQSPRDGCATAWLAFHHHMGTVIETEG